MSQVVIPDEGGLWVLVEENANSCSIDAEAGVAEGVLAEDARGKGPVVLFLMAVGAAALHLVGA